HFLYTGGVGEYYNHAGQFDSMFPRLQKLQSELERPCITTSYYPAMDHVAFLCEHRLELVGQACRQINSMLASLPQSANENCERPANELAIAEHQLHDSAASPEVLPLPEFVCAPGASTSTGI
ncbi:MAG: hypothetical protein AAF483_21630, partial [Planctomycetota bacterium]